MKNPFEAVTPTAEEFTKIKTELKYLFNDNPKILHLVLKGKWFDMIASGEKREEYREIKRYWARRLCGNTIWRGKGKGLLPGDQSNFDSWYPETFKDFDIVVFHHGYKKNRRQMIFQLNFITIGHGLSSWGAELGKEYFVIKLADEVGRVNF